jgi:CDP-diacylglycerol--serine O-phosphatidyltransferase
MISTIRYRSFKDLDLKRRRPAWILPAIAVVFAVIAFRPTLSLLVLTLVFAASGPVARAAGFIRRKRPESEVVKRET